MSDRDIAGTWIHRSYLNMTDLLGRMAFNSDKLDQATKEKMALGLGMNVVKGLIWAEGVAVLTDTSDGKGAGQLMFGPDFVLKLVVDVGPAGYGSPRSVQIEAEGIDGTDSAAFRYSLNGWFTDPWPEIDAPLPTVVGSIINRNPNKPDEPKDVGTHGSFILVKTLETPEQIFGKLAKASANPPE